MKKSKKLMTAVSALVPLSMISAGEVHAVTTSVPMAAEIVPAITLAAGSSLSFGNLTVTAIGTSVITPSAGARSVTGGVTAAGGTFQAGSFTYNGADVAITVATTAASFTITNGSTPLTVNAFHLEGDASGNSITIANPGATELITLGGTLNFAGVPASGSYAGNAVVTVAYQ